MGEAAQVLAQQRDPHGDAEPVEDVLAAGRDAEGQRADFLAPSAGGVTSWLACTP